MRFSLVALLVVALCYVVSSDWRSWSGGGDGRLLSIPTATGNVSYAHDGWTPKPTAAPDAIQSDGDRVLDILKRDTASSNWTNAETCGWIAGSESSSFGCGKNGTCATNDNHIVACVTGTYSPFYSMCLNYEEFKSSSCKNQDSSTGCCMDTEYPECATYLWVEPPQRSMYRCWKTSVMITMLDKPEIVEDHATRTATSSALPLPDGSTDDPSQQSDADQGPTLGQRIGLSVGVGILLCASIFIMFRTFRKQRRSIRQAAKGRNRVRNQLASLFQNSDNGGGGGTTSAPHVQGQESGIVLVDLPPIPPHLRGPNDQPAIRMPEPAVLRNDNTRAYAEMLNAPQTPDQSRINSRNRDGYIHLDHTEPTSSTAALYGSEASSPVPPSYASYIQQYEQPRQRIPGGSYGATATRPETPPPMYQPSFQSDSTLGLGFGNVASASTLNTNADGAPNWIELSRSSPTLPAATRLGTMWRPEGAGTGGIPASSTWQDISGSVLSDEAKGQTEEGEPRKTAANDDDEGVFGAPRRGQQE